MQKGSSHNTPTALKIAILHSVEQKCSVCSIKPEQNLLFFFYFLAPNITSVLNYELKKTKSSKHAAFTQRTLNYSRTCTPPPPPLLSFYSLLDAPNAFLCFMVWVVHRKTSYQSHPALCCKKRWKGTQREPDSGALFSACSHGGERRYQKCNRSWFHIRTACVTDMLSKLWRLCCLN